MTKWTEFVREYADKHNIPYGCALSRASVAYHKMNGTTPKKKKGFAEDVVSEPVKEVMYEPPRPQRKLTSASKLNLMQSKKNRRQVLQNVLQRKQERAFDPPTSLDAPPPTPMRTRPAPSVRKGKGMRRYMDGFGLSMMSSHEDANGLTHIYPLTHKMIKNMIRGF
jgi:hypothetical protein